MLGAPIAPNGEPARGGWSAEGASRHASLGINPGAEAFIPDTTLADGLNVDALALSIQGEASGDGAGLYPEEEAGFGGTVTEEWDGIGGTGE